MKAYFPTIVLSVSAVKLRHLQ